MILNFVYIFHFFSLQKGDTLFSLYAAHQKGEPKNAGVDVLNAGGGVVDTAAAGIYDLFAGKQLALKLAVNAAATVLRVDQVCLFFLFFL
jgi:chaperonin GroEL (HSP60 family)